MPILRILQYPDLRLYKIAAPIAQVDDEVRALVRDMAETMYKAPGIGLAATQVDVHRRVIVIDVSPTHDQLQVLINPQVVLSEGESPLEEGCLSVPGIYDRVPRADRIVVRALDGEGVPFEREATGLLSVCVQHEMDHLDGKVFVDYLSRLKRTRIQAKLRKAERKAG